MVTDLKRGKILFVDDQPDAVAPYVKQLQQEGFTNVVLMNEVTSFNDLINHRADLIFLDITGVATGLDKEDEGLAVLQYVKTHAPWTRIVVLSGSAFPASRAIDLTKADLCVTKASLTLADLVTVTEDELEHGLAPEYRNAKVLEIIGTHLDSLNLGWYRRWRINRIIRAGREHAGDASFDWPKLVGRARSTLQMCSELTGLLQLLA